jgi:hypothetical protein
MRDKLMLEKWRAMAYSAATLATLILAVGAKWKPSLGGH